MPQCEQKVIKLGHHNCFWFENDAPHFIVLPRITYIVHVSIKLMNFKISTGKGEYIKFLYPLGSP